MVVVNIKRRERAVEGEGGCSSSLMAVEENGGH